MPSLLLSYYALPPNLKRCFAYCAVFPKDTLLQKDDLIKLWMANGLLSSKGEKELKKISEHYFDDLVMHSFLQNIETDRFENIVSCKMHDLVHDLTRSLIENEVLFMEGLITHFDSGKV